MDIFVESFHPLFSDQNSDRTQLYVLAMYSAHTNTNDLVTPIFLQPGNILSFQKEPTKISVQSEFVF